MDKKLIFAAILSLIGAGIPALFFGLSLYTIMFLPAFIIVLIVNIWGGQTARAVWLGFLLSLMVIPFPTFLAVFPSLFGDTLGRTILFVLLTGVTAFIIVFAVFFSRQETSRIPDRRLAVFTGILFLLTAIVIVADEVWYIKLFYRTSEQLRGHSQLNWPYIILSTSFQVIIAIGISVLLFLRERFTYFVVTPIFLVYNLLLALNRVFIFTNGHLYPREMINLLMRPFRIDTEVIFIVYRIYALLILVFVVYFLRNYTHGTKKD
jgi:hypothetical protein